MKLKLGQTIALAIALVFSAFLIYEAPFQAAAAASATSQVVYAPMNDPPVIGNAPGKLDYPLLLLELGFVVFVGGAIFLASQPEKELIPDLPVASADAKKTGLASPVFLGRRIFS